MEFTLFSFGFEKINNTFFWGMEIGRFQKTNKEPVPFLLILWDGDELLMQTFNMVFPIFRKK